MKPSDDPAEREPTSSGDPDDLAQRIQEMRPSQPSGPGGGPARALVLMFSLGSTFAGSLVAGWFGGQWLDHHFGTNYWSLVGLMLGLAGGVTAAVQMLKPFFQT